MPVIRWKSRPGDTSRTSGNPLSQHIRVLIRDEAYRATVT